MRSFRLILVAVRELRSRRNLALDRAAGIAAGSGARIELFHDLSTPVYVDTMISGGKSLEEFKRTLRAAALRRLELLAKPLRARGLKVSTATAWDYPPFEAVVRRAVAIHADLIVANKRGHHRLPTVLGYTDWELLRASPVPVLLTKHARYRARAAVLAAIDPLHAAAGQRALERQILRQAAGLAIALRAPLHAVHVLAPWEQSGQDRAALVARLARPARIRPARIHLLEGSPDVLLPATARRLRAGAVVMGAMSRRGLQRFFVGNSAERLLDDFHCDVLVVKPPRFALHMPRARRGIFFLPTMPLA